MKFDTRLLYYEDSKIFDFEAVVLDCSETKDGFSVVLDKTAFFPEAGGQYGDEGFLGDVEVYDTQITEKGIEHFTRAPLTVGEKVRGRVNSELRLKRMRDHTGEHILSSVVHRKFGYDNVGFHMSAHSMDVDFNGDFTKEELKQVEAEANEIIRKNVKVKCYYPSAEELATMEYRSKLELESPRIVEIEGYDLCACCAPHAYSTGEVGYLIITESKKNRSNTRLTLMCGADAVEYAKDLYLSAYKAGVILSAKPTGVGDAVEKLAATNEELRKELQSLKRELTAMQLDSLKETDGYLVAFTDPSSQKDLLNKGLTLSKSGACVFAGANGSYSYMIASETQDVRGLAQALNKAFDGKGGGRPNACQGRVNGKEEEIKAFIKNYAES